MSTASSGADLSSKFQKLAAEYAKVRAQLPVLKSALLDERDKTATLEAELRERDQRCRTMATEMESLVFRNQQLTKRVEFLQEQLGGATAASPGNRFFSRSSVSGKRANRDAVKQSVSHDHLAGADVSRVLEEELKRKVEENEFLNAQIFEAKNVHAQEMTEAKNRIRVLEAEITSLRSEIENAKDRQEAVLSELRSEKADLRKEFDVVQSSLANCKRECEMSNSVRSAALLELEETRRLVSRVVLFDDSRSEAWNRFNAPASAKDSETRFSLFLSSLRPVVSQALTHLGLFHSYCKQRAHLYPHDTSLGESLSEVNKEYSELIRRHANVCRTIESAFHGLVDACESGDGHEDRILSSLGPILSSYVAYDDFILAGLPLVRKAVDEECLVDWCNSRLQKENHAWGDAYGQFAAAVSGLSTPLRPVLALSSIDDTLVEDLVSSLEKFNDAVKGLCDQFSQKIVYEHQLPVATRQLRTTNECIAAALNTSSKYVTELWELVSRNRDLLLRCSKKLSERLAEWSSWRRLAASYYRSVESIPLDDAGATQTQNPTLSGFLTGASPDSNSALVSRRDDGRALELETLVREKEMSLRALEKEREKWSLETQLLTMKLEQYHQQAGCGGESAELRGEERWSTKAAAFAEEYYGNRIADLCSKFQDTNSRVLYFQSECLSLMKTLQAYQKHKNKLVTDSKEASQRIVALKDELETTRKGYESQLSTLSEHLAQMNQKLTKQTDEIDMLRQVANDKAHKRTLFK